MRQSKFNDWTRAKQSMGIFWVCVYVCVQSYGEWTYMGFSRIQEPSSVAIGVRDGQLETKAKNGLGVILLDSSCKRNCHLLNTK